MAMLWLFSACVGVELPLICSGPSIGSTLSKIPEPCVTMGHAKPAPRKL